MGITGALWMLQVREWVVYVRMIGSYISLLSPLGLNFVRVPNLHIQ